MDMTKEKIYLMVTETLQEICNNNSIDIIVDSQTPLIGSNRILDSLGLVNFIVDVEGVFLDEDIEITLTSESAMSAKISPFRSIGSLCNFIATQLKIEE